MLKWLKNHILSDLNHPELVVPLPTHILNPEKSYMYQNKTDLRCKPLMDKEIIKFQYHKLKTKDEVEQTITEFDPLKDEKYSDQLKDLHEVLASELLVEKMLAIETHHCPQSFGILLHSEKHGRMFYTSDTALCNNVLAYARDVKLLITEASLENDLES